MACVVLQCLRAKPVVAGMEEFRSAIGIPIDFMEMLGVDLRILHAGETVGQGLFTAVVCEGGEADAELVQRRFQFRCF